MKAGRKWKNRVAVVISNKKQGLIVMRRRIVELSKTMKYTCRGNRKKSRKRNIMSKRRDCMKKGDVILGSKIPSLKRSIKRTIKLINKPMGQGIKRYLALTHSPK